jgi:hypothetical protein
MRMRPIRGFDWAHSTAPGERSRLGRAVAPLAGFERSERCLEDLSPGRARRRDEVALRARRDPERPGSPRLAPASSADSAKLAGGHAHDLGDGPTSKPLPAVIIQIKDDATFD